jgi:hypothetical protein
MYHVFFMKPETEQSVVITAIATSDCDSVEEIENRLAHFGWVKRSNWYGSAASTATGAILEALSNGFTDHPKYVASAE